MRHHPQPKAVSIYVTATTKIYTILSGWDFGAKCPSCHIPLEKYISQNFCNCGAWKSARDNPPTLDYQ
jgi:hypothetical protein